MVPAFMLMLLARQQQLLQDRFKARYPSAWLVWEPGDWKPPPHADSDGGKTQLPQRTRDLSPRGGDALCFQLYLPKGAAEAELSLGGPPTATWW